MEQNALERKEARDDSLDRLSMLPDSLLLEILSPLKARELAQTCILAKRWFKLWSFVPCLCFDIADFVKGDTREVTVDVLKKYRDFVTSFLSARDAASNIDTFRLLCPGMDFNGNMNRRQFDKLAASANMWIRHALKHNPKIFEVSFRGSRPFALLPNCFFTCKTLEDVNICIDREGYYLWNPGRVWLPRLKNLQLTYVEFNKNLDMTLSGCPALESLILDGCFLCSFSSNTVKQLQLSECIIEELTISAPRVEIIKLDVDMEKEITLKDASKVIQAAFLSYGNFLHDSYCCNLLSSLSGIQSLQINTVYLKQILESESPKCPTFGRLKNLTLNAFCMNSCFDALCFFLNHCPKLEVLTLHSWITCELLDEQHSEEEHDENLEMIDGFLCERLRTLVIQYDQSCTVARLKQLILERTREQQHILFPASTRRLLDYHKE